MTLRKVQVSTLPVTLPVTNMVLNKINELWEFTLPHIATRLPVGSPTLPHCHFPPLL